MNSHLVGLILAWLGYFALHSLLASLRVKCLVAARWPDFMPWYRLSFNLLAVLLLAPPLYLLYSWPGPVLLAWEGAWSWLANGLALGALLLFLYSMRYYDGSEFLGLRQLRERETRVEDQENLCISPLHRHVRHPWYFIALVLIWTRDMHLAMLVSAILMTLYFVIGSRLEERKLMAYHGPVYADYRRQVPGLLPLPWKRLSAEQARELASRHQRTG